MMRRDLWIGLAVSVLAHELLLGGFFFSRSTPDAPFQSGRESIALKLQPALPAPEQPVHSTPPVEEVPDQPVEVPLAPDPDVAREPVPEVEVAEDPPREIEEIERDTDQPPSEAAPERHARVYEEEGVETVPRSIGLVRPEYPFLSRRRGEEGDVTVEVDVRMDGYPGDVRIVGSSGHRRLDQAAVDAMEAARFEPASQWGRPVAATHRWTFTFRLEDARP